MNIKIVYTGAVSFFAGVAFTYVCFRGLDRSSVSEISRPSVHTLTQKASVRADKIHKTQLDPKNMKFSEAENFVKERSEPVSPVVTLESLYGKRPSQEYGQLVVVPEGLISSLSLAAQKKSLDKNLFSEDGQFAAILQLNASEKETLESGWHQLREKVRHLESDTAQITEMPDGSLEVVLPDLNRSMSELGDGFQKQAHQVLGPNRTDVLMAYAQIDSVMSDLGAGRKIKISPEEAGDGTWRFHTVIQSGQEKRSFVGNSVPSELEHIVGGLQISNPE